MTDHESKTIINNGKVTSFTELKDEPDTPPHECPVNPDYLDAAKRLWASCCGSYIRKQFQRFERQRGKPRRKFMLILLDNEDRGSLWSAGRKNGLKQAISVLEANMGNCVRGGADHQFAINMVVLLKAALDHDDAYDHLESWEKKNFPHLFEAQRGEEG